MGNYTQLNPDSTFERHVYHRDQFAHYLRWTHVLKRIKIGLNILDWGCGSGNLLEVIYRNRFKAKKYLGLEYRQKTVDNNNKKYEVIKEWSEFKQQDLLKNDFNYGKEWDIICSFEVLEHIGKKNVDIFLKNLHDHCNKNTVVLISTPVYDEKVGAADNHIIDGEIGELTFDEMKNSLINNGFTIINKWGTFASQKDYLDKMNSSQLDFYNSVKDYFDSNILSNLMAPLFPEYSRNVMWELKIS